MGLLKRVRHELGVMKYNVRCEMWKGLKKKGLEVQVNSKQGKYFISTRDSVIGRHLYATGSSSCERCRQ